MRPALLLLLCATLLLLLPASRSVGPALPPGRTDIVEKGLRIGPRGPSRWRLLMHYASGRLTADETVVMRIWTALPESYAEVRLT